LLVASKDLAFGWSRGSLLFATIKFFNRALSANAGDAALISKGGAWPRPCCMSEELITGY
jgi:hypothetical protein